MASVQKLEVGFVFVSLDSSGKPNSSKDRRLIRSHCMRGKNRRIGVAGQSTGIPSIATCGSAMVAQREIDVDGDEGAGVEEVEMIPLPRAPSQLSLVKLAVDVDSRMKLTVLEFVRFSPETLTPVKLLLDCDTSYSARVHWLFHNPAYVQSIILVVSAAGELIDGRMLSMSPRTYGHWGQTIMLLKAQLSSSDVAVSLADATIDVVATLALGACIRDDYSEAKMHIAGLQRMTRIRPMLTLNPRLICKIRHLNLIYPVCTGSCDLLCTPPLPYSPRLFDLGPHPCAIKHHAPSVYGAVDARVSTIFHETQYYACVINNTYITRTRRSESEFDTIMFSFQHRLLRLDNDVDDGVSELLRLGLLAFLVSRFHCGWMTKRYPYLANKLRESCLGFNFQANPESRELLRWLLIVGAMSVFHVDLDVEEWMWVKWRDEVDDIGWEEANAQLNRIVWIDTPRGKGPCDTFETFNSRRLKTFSG
ncbi:hypothetical protein BDW59DRAFT_161459 [Aspergillus cavernicola]|uniref:Fungal-specific transcription factor domain-containing protein n=1 Tax=Aspergillus cavernicola TaxID=176166 RepID=A0ABR4IDH7_9EURO